LRAAIEQANATAGPDTIGFNILGNEVQTIVVNCSGLGPLPTIEDQVTIDGYTQPEAHPNTKAVGDDTSLKVELTQTNLTDGIGLGIDTASGSVIKGLVMSGFGIGIGAFGDSAGTRIQGNFIGTDKSGTKDLGNDGSGVVISGDFAVGNTLEGNTVGGTTAASRNVISGNHPDGIDFSLSQGTKVLGNRVGTTADGKGSLGNDEDGVSVAAGVNNSIGNDTSGRSNTVAFNDDDGVGVFRVSSTDDEISRSNMIFSNVGIGIDLEGSSEDALGKTANDPGDADAAPTPCKTSQS
jgi:hypothetical protein